MMEKKNKIKPHKTIIFIIPILLISTVLINSKIYGQVKELDWLIEIVSEGHGFTEGPVLTKDGKIFFTDMDNGNILRFDPSTGTTDIWNNKSGKANGLFIHSNYLYSCEAIGRSVVRYDLNKGPGSREVLASTFRGDSLGSPNDLTIIGDYLYFSEFWLGMYLDNTSNKREIFLNHVYKMSLKDLMLDTLAFTFGMPNGVAKSPDDKQLFIADSQSNKLVKAEVKDGKPGPMKEIADVSIYGLAVPDGLAVSRDGRIFLALYGDSEKLVVLDSGGNAIGYLATGPLTSNCVFAADDKTLYITANKKLMRVVVPEMEK